MRVGAAEKGAKGRGSGPTRRFLWWSHKRCQIVQLWRRRKRRRTEILRFHVVASLGQQEWSVSVWTSRDFLSARSHRHRRVLWVDQMHSATTGKTLPPLLTTPSAWQTDFSTLCHLCRGGDHRNHARSRWIHGTSRNIRRSLPRLRQGMVENQGRGQRPAS